ncbi:MAG: dienelactone hydrolase family protein [Gammaproteobacteria bacterium]
MKVLFLGLMAALFSLSALAGEEVKYTVGDTEFTGYLAKPEGDANGGGVIVVHEWWGHNQYVRDRADMLAKMGYTAFAVDMYGDGKLADHPKTAGKFAGEVKKNMDEGVKRFQAGMDLLSAQPGVDKSKIGAIGYCFGGGLVLEMARRGLPLASVASFHGSLGGLSPVSASGDKAKILVANGADDPFVKPEQIEQFKADMSAAGFDYEFVNYPGAVHSFTNKGATAIGEKFGLPLAYNAEADEKSWQAMKELFAETLK